MSKVIINLVAEGDSWFSVPAIPPGFTNIIEVLERFPSFTYSHENQRYSLVYKHAAIGRTLQDMVDAEQGNSNIERAFKRYRSTSQLGNVKALLLAGGGNDFLDKLDSLLNKNQQETTDKDAVNEAVKDAFNESMMEKFIEELREDYQYFINLCKNDRYNCKVVTLSYCYPKPQKNGHLGKIFARKGYNKADIRKKICKIMIDNYLETLLKDLANENEGSFYYVASHEKVKEKYYIDEIHLDLEGCRIVARAIEEKLNEIFFPTKNVSGNVKTKKAKNTK